MIISADITNLNSVEVNLPLRNKEQKSAHKKVKITTAKPSHSDSVDRTKSLNKNLQIRGVTLINETGNSDQADQIIKVLNKLVENEVQAQKKHQSGLSEPPPQAIIILKNVKIRVLNEETIKKEYGKDYANSEGLYDDDKNTIIINADRLKGNEADLALTLIEEALHAKQDREAEQAAIQVNKDPKKQTTTHRDTEAEIAKQVQSYVEHYKNKLGYTNLSSIVAVSEDPIKNDGIHTRKTTRFHHVPATLDTSNQPQLPQYGLMSFEAFAAMKMEEALGVPGVAMTVLTFEYEQEVSHVRKVKRRGNNESVRHTTSFKKIPVQMTAVQAWINKQNGGFDRGSWTAKDDWDDKLRQHLPEDKWSNIDNLPNDLVEQYKTYLKENTNIPAAENSVKRQLNEAAVENDIVRKGLSGEGNVVVSPLQVGYWSGASGAAPWIATRGLMFQDKDTGKNAVVILSDPVTNPKGKVTVMEYAHQQEESFVKSLFNPPKVIGNVSEQHRYRNGEYSLSDKGKIFFSAFSKEDIAGWWPYSGTESILEMALGRGQSLSHKFDNDQLQPWDDRGYLAYQSPTAESIAKLLVPKAIEREGNDAKHAFYTIGDERWNSIKEIAGKAIEFLGNIGPILSIVLPAFPIFEKLFSAVMLTTGGIELVKQFFDPNSSRKDKEEAILGLIQMGIEMNRYVDGAQSPTNAKTPAQIRQDLRNQFKQHEDPALRNLFNDEAGESARPENSESVVGETNDYPGVIGHNFPIQSGRLASTFDGDLPKPIKNGPHTGLLQNRAGELFVAPEGPGGKYHQVLPTEDPNIYHLKSGSEFQLRRIAVGEAFALERKPNTFIRGGGKGVQPPKGPSDQVANRLKNLQLEQPARVGALVIEKQSGNYVFSHYSFDLVQGPNGAGILKDNDHITVENTLAAFITDKKNKTNPYAVEEWIDNTQNLDKRKFNDILRKNGYGEVDNFNFRPKPDYQKPTSQKQYDQSNAGDVKKNPSDAVEVDESISLESFVAWLHENLPALDVDEANIRTITESLENMAGRMGYGASELFLNASQRKDFTKLVLIMKDLKGELKGMGAFKQLIKADPSVTIRPSDLEKLTADQLGITDDQLSKYKTDWMDGPKDAKGNIVVKSGENHRGWTELSNFMMNKAWNLVQKEFGIQQ